ncbi:thiamine diphosphate-binding protein [Podospora australis]|uniref:Pyruvate decarboxylase n=1 Tax=Podospora australis TaxID=1536484 RepID=A0AAN7AGF9_9PEZI|nr:thiamine diphosphate-binding protein [Podospora australis]
MPEVLVGEYLFLRLKELGIHTVFGVPGDFELALLDLIEPLGLKWVGAPNELVGAYAADGYARVNGMGALVTTFGPGELSALCGIGGAYCESVPILHIVGYPTVPAQKSGKILHHTLGDGKFDHYQRISSELSCATAVLDDPTTAPAEIDRVLTAMIYNSKPGYIGISEDIAYAKVSAEYLNTKIPRTLNPSAPDSEAATVTKIVSTLESAKAPVLIVDGGAARSDWGRHTDALIQALKIPFLTTGLGKGIADETSPYYHGVYGGEGSYPRDVINTVEQQADCILWLGNCPSDFNTGIFTEHLNHCTIIDLQRFSVKIGETKYDGRINHIIPLLTLIFTDTHPPLAQLPISPFRQILPIALPESNKIEQDWLWSRLSSYLHPGDLVITETGTAQVGINSTRFPSGCHGWTQSVYGSIGYAAGASAGAAIAAKESGTYQRLVLITGEGSLQLTIQAFSMLNQGYGITPVVFVLNNSGYTIERYFCGWTAKYNDIPMWDYTALFKALTTGTTKGFKVRTAGELDGLLDEKEFNEAEYPQCVEMMMDRFDAPAAMKRTFEVKKAREAAQAAVGEE